MASDFSVALSKMTEDLDLQKVYIAENFEEIKVSTFEVNRPGLELTGYFDFFDSSRLLLFGTTEFSYLSRFGSEAQKMVIDSILSFGPPAIIISRNIEPPIAMMESAKTHKVSILRSAETTSQVTAALFQYLNKELAPRITRHGVLVEVYGEGCLLLGDSGVGKSETAIELIKRGHRLVADDAVEIRKTSTHTLMGQSPENIRHFIELRGIGIIDARRIFGMGAVKSSEKIDMVIQLEAWDSTKAYDRLGLDNEYANVLGVKVPAITVPITPGRNLAVIVETAAMNNRQKKMGYNAAKDLMISLGMDDVQPEDKEIEIWQS